MAHELARPLRARRSAAGCQLTPEADDTVRFFTLRHADRSEVERVCLALGLVAVDPGCAVYRPDTGRGEQEA
jgi:hypothetical protein